MPKWYDIKAKADDSAEISIYDEIGAWGVTAKQFIGDLKAQAGKNITVTINSPGGSVFDALAIYNALRGHGSEITTKVMGVAASAASMIFMAGDKRIMPENTFLMIHNPLTFAYGNAEELRDIADTLDKIGASLVNIYVSRSNKSEEEVKAMLADDTWLNAADAADAGFVDEVEAEMKIAASFDLDRLPENIRAAFEHPNGDGVTDDPEASAGNQAGAPDPQQAADQTVTEQITAVVVAAGFGNLASVWLLDDSVKSVADVQPKIAEAREIRALCVAANQPEESDKLIKARATLADARKRLTDILAEKDEETHTDGHAPSSNSKPAKSAQPAALKTADVWAARRNLH